MKVLTIFLVCMFGIVSVSFGATMTNEQYNNFGVIDEYLRDKYPTYTGMVGDKDAMTALGISDYTFTTELHSINLDQLKENDKRAKAVKKLRNKLKGLGFDSDDLEILGLTNIIPD